MHTRLRNHNAKNANWLGNLWNLNWNFPFSFHRNIFSYPYRYGRFIETDGNISLSLCNPEFSQKRISCEFRGNSHERSILGRKFFTLFYRKFAWNLSLNSRELLIGFSRNPLTNSIRQNTLCIDAQSIFVIQCSWILYFLLSLRSTWLAKVVNIVFEFLLQQLIAKKISTSYLEFHEMTLI